MSRIKWLFIGPDGLRHGWRFLIFVAAIVLVAQFLEQLAIAFLGAKLHVDRSGLSASSIILGDGFDLIVVLIVTGVLRFANAVASTVTASRSTKHLVDYFGMA